MIRAWPSPETVMSTVEALDRAFAGEPCELVQPDGTSRAMRIDRWQRAATPADAALFIDRCHGSTLDVGCGPGRLAAALTDRGLDTLGIDISREAVRQTMERGAAAVRVDVFDDFPGARTWQHVLLADGNIGVGGDPVRLLRRVAVLLAPGGTALVELAGTTGGAVHEQVRLRIGRVLSVPFGWATVGIDAIDDVAYEAGLQVRDVHHAFGRSVAILTDLASSPRPEGRP